MPKWLEETTFKELLSFVKVFFVRLISVCLYTVGMTKRLFCIVIHLCKMQYELDKTMESALYLYFAYIAAVIFFLQKSSSRGIKSPNNQQETCIEAICQCPLY
jgi:hypothetical protein